jgi:hypothetical protein
MNVIDMKMHYVETIDPLKKLLQLQDITSQGINTFGIKTKST